MVSVRLLQRATRRSFPVLDPQFAGKPAASSACVGYWCDRLAKPITLQRVLCPTRNFKIESVFRDTPILPGAMQDDTRTCSGQDINLTPRASFWGFNDPHSSPAAARQGIAHAVYAYPRLRFDRVGNC